VAPVILTDQVIPFPTVFGGSEPFTLACWFRVNGPAGGTVDIFSADVSSDNSFPFRLYCATSNFYLTFVDMNGQTIIKTLFNDPWSYYDWAHLTVVFEPRGVSDNSGWYRFYFRGEGIFDGTETPHEACAQLLKRHSEVALARVERARKQKIKEKISPHT